jgi:hypothetical protein
LGVTTCNIKVTFGSTSFFSLNASEGPTLQKPDGSWANLDPGTTLGDIRTTDPTAYVVDVDNPANEHRKSSFVLLDDGKYRIVLQQG